MFVQMNARYSVNIPHSNSQPGLRLVELDDQWREMSRWIKYQENVEDGGNRWSKPFVPSW